jgi:hypothetical protein
MERWSVDPGRNGEHSDALGSSPRRVPRLAPVSSRISMSCVAGGAARELGVRASIDQQGMNASQFCSVSRISCGSSDTAERQRQRRQQQQQVAAQAVFIDSPGSIQDIWHCIEDVGPWAPRGGEGAVGKIGCPAARRIAKRVEWSVVRPGQTCVRSCGAGHKSHLRLTGSSGLS